MTLDLRVHYLKIPAWGVTIGAECRRLPSPLPPRTVVERPIWPFSLAFGQTPPVGWLWEHDHYSSHAATGGGCGRSSTISRKISWNICRGLRPGPLGMHAEPIGTLPAPDAAAAIEKPCQTFSITQARNGSVLQCSPTTAKKTSPVRRLKTGAEII